MSVLHCTCNSQSKAKLNTHHQHHFLQFNPKSRPFNGLNPESKTSMPAEQKPVLVTPASSLKESGGQTEGMIRQNALVDVCDGICATRMIAKPHSASAIHHHGEENTIVFAFSGHGAVVSDGGKKRQELGPGDFALIPAYAEHQEVNDSDEDVVWSIVRSGRTPVVVNLPEGWGSS